MSLNRGQEMKDKTPVSSPSYYNSPINKRKNFMLDNEFSFNEYFKKYINEIESTIETRENCKIYFCKGRDDKNYTIFEIRKNNSTLKKTKWKKDLNIYKKQMLEVKQLSNLANDLQIEKVKVKLTFEDKKMTYIVFKGHIQQFSNSKDILFNYKEDNLADNIRKLASFLSNIPNQREMLALNTDYFFISNANEKTNLNRSTLDFRIINDYNFEISEKEFEKIQTYANNYKKEDIGQFIYILFLKCLSKLLGIEELILIANDYAASKLYFRTPLKENKAKTSTKLFDCNFQSKSMKYISEVILYVINNFEIINQKQINYFLNKIEGSYLIEANFSDSLLIEFQSYNLVENPKLYDCDKFFQEKNQIDELKKQIEQFLGKNLKNNFLDNLIYIIQSSRQTLFSIAKSINLKINEIINYTDLGKILLDSIVCLISENASFQNNISKLKEKSDNQNIKIIRLEQNICSYKERIRMSNNEIEDLKKLLSEYNIRESLQEENKKLKMENTVLKEKMLDLQLKDKKIKTQSIEIEFLNNEISNQNENIRIHKNEIKSLVENIENLNKEYTIKEGNLKIEFEDRYKKLSDSLMQERVKEINDMKINYENEIKELRKELEITEREKINAFTKATEFSNQFNFLNSQLEEQMGKFYSEKNELNNQIQNQLSQLSTLEQEKAVLKSQNDELNLKLIDKKEEMLNFLNNKDDSLNQFLSLKKVGIYDTTFEIKYQSLEDDYSRLEYLYKGKINEIEELQTEIIKLSKEIESYNSQLILLQDKNSSLHYQIIEKEDQIKFEQYKGQNEKINTEKYKACISKYERLQKANMNHINNFVCANYKQIRIDYLSLLNETNKFNLQFKEIIDLYIRKKDLVLVKTQIENETKELNSKIIKLRIEKIRIHFLTNLLTKNCESAKFYNTKLEEDIDNILREGDTKFDFLSLKKRNDSLKLQFIGGLEQINNDAPLSNDPLFSISCNYCHNKNDIFPASINKNALEIIPQFMKLNSLLRITQFEKNEGLIIIKHYKNQILKLVNIITSIQNEKTKDKTLYLEQLNRDDILNEDEYFGINFKIELVKDFQSSLRHEINEKLQLCNQSTGRILESLLSDKLEDNIEFILNDK